MRRARRRLVTPQTRRRDDHSRPPRWRGPPTPRASGAAAGFPAEPARRRARPPAGPAHTAPSPPGRPPAPPTPPTLRTQLRSAAIPPRDLSLTLWSRKPSSHSRSGRGSTWKPSSHTPTAVDNQRRNHDRAAVTAAKEFTAKAIFGLLLAVVMVAAFATAGSAENTGNPRSGDLHVTKECSQYYGHAGEFCTITGSNLNAIRPGMKVIYTNAAEIHRRAWTADLVLDGPGNNDAYGHVTLNLLTGTGPLTFSGGTGRFSGFHASVTVTARPRPLYVGRTVQLHPTRPRQISGCATRSQPPQPAGTGPPVPRGGSASARCPGRSPAKRKGAAK